MIRVKDFFSRLTPNPVTWSLEAVASIQSMGMDRPAVLISVLLGAAPVLLAAADSLTEQRIDELRYLVRQDCGSCHGMTMRGGLGPPLTPDALDGKPSELLAVTIRDGRAGTAMPPWREFLSDEEIAWIVNELTEGSLNQ